MCISAQNALSASTISTLDRMIALNSLSLSLLCFSLVFLAQCQQPPLTEFDSQIGTHEAAKPKRLNEVNKSSVKDRIHKKREGHRKKQQCSYFLSPSKISVHISHISDFLRDASQAIQCAVTKRKSKP